MSVIDTLLATYRRDSRLIVDASSVKLTDVQAINGDLKRTFSIVLKVSKVDAEKIEVILRELLPRKVWPKVFFPPVCGYHFTIQWTPEECFEKADVPKLIGDIADVFAGQDEIVGDLYFPFIGWAGVFGSLITRDEQAVFSLRTRLELIWEKYQLTLGLKPKDYSLTYISTVRYVEKFTDEEIKTLLEVRPKQISEVRLSEVLVVLNDKFLTPEKTTVLRTIKLG